MDNITKEDLNNLINSALNIVYKNDKNLIDIGLSTFDSTKFTDTNKHNGERAVVFRFTYYLQNLIVGDDRFKNYIVDCEYNRHIYGVKKIAIKDNKIVSIIPDVVIHNRQKDNFNLLVIECKGWWNKDKVERDDDYDKLKYLTNQEKEYKYNYGLFIEFSKDREKTINGKIWYEDGQVK